MPNKFNTQFSKRVASPVQDIGPSLKDSRCFSEGKTQIQAACSLGVATTACLCFCVFLSGCSKTIDDRGSETVDFTSAKQVVSSIFFAAKHGKSHHLASLCDPEGSANQYARRVCAETVGGEDWPAFVRQFSKGHLLGEARISENHAMVNFAFGPEGTDSETMELVRRGKQWYLLAF